jgi:ankyrin repeat protein
VVRFAILAVAYILAGGPLSAQTPPSDRDLRVYAGLHAAAANGDVAEIERLIGAGERPNIQDSNSRTPLHVAVYRKHHAAARALIRLGADTNAFDAQSYDVVTIAAVQNDIEMLKIVLEGGASARNTTSPTMEPR